MAKKKSNEGWLVAGLLMAGLVALYYLQTGLGKENDSALIPGTLEGKIDALIDALNSRFGRRWVNTGVWILKSSLQESLPASLVTLVDVVAKVESMSWGLSSLQKQQLAVQMARPT